MSPCGFTMASLHDSLCPHYERTNAMQIDQCFKFMLLASLTIRTKFSGFVVIHDSANLFSLSLVKFDAVPLLFPRRTAHAGLAIWIPALSKMPLLRLNHPLLKVTPIHKQVLGRHSL